MTQPTTQPTTTEPEPAAPGLAAIEESYEQAKASIIDPQPAPLNWVHDPDDPHPPTEAIDVDAALPPVPGEAAEGAPRTRDPLGLRRWWRAFWTT